MWQGSQTVLPWHGWKEILGSMKNMNVNNYACIRHVYVYRYLLYSAVHCQTPKLILLYDYTDNDLA